LNENHGAAIVNFLEHQLSSLFLLCVINNEVVIVNLMNDDLLGVDEIDSIPSTFDPNFAPMDTKELNVFIQQK
jgi:hypothetical protein